MGRYYVASGCCSLSMTRFHPRHFAKAKGSQVKSRNDTTLLPGHFSPEIPKGLARLGGRLFHFGIVTG
jgi:hypothetical protein